MFPNVIDKLVYTLIYYGKIDWIRVEMVSTLKDTDFVILT